MYADQLYSPVYISSTSFGPGFAAGGGGALRLRLVPFTVVTESSFAGSLTSERVSAWTAPAVPGCDWAVQRIPMLPARCSDMHANP
jgi:hypothetical protein